MATKYAFAALKKTGEIVEWGSSTLGGDAGDKKPELINIKAVGAHQNAFAAMNHSGKFIFWGRETDFKEAKRDCERVK